MSVVRSFCFLLMASSVFAEPTLPNGCQVLAVQGEVLTIQAKKSKLLFVHNLSGADLWVTHPGATPSAMGWSSRLQNQNWSALVVDKGPFVLSCIESRPGHEQQIPCEGALAICHWRGAKIPASNQNAYWAGEDMSLAGLKAALGGQGFVINRSAVRFRATASSMARVVARL